MINELIKFEHECYMAISKKFISKDYEELKSQLKILMDEKATPATILRSAATVSDITTTFIYICKRDMPARESSNHSKTSKLSAVIEELSNGVSTLNHMVSKTTSIVQFQIDKAEAFSKLHDSPQHPFHGVLDEYDMVKRDSVTMIKNVCITMIMSIIKILVSECKQYRDGIFKQGLLWEGSGGVGASVNLIDTHRYEYHHNHHY